MALVLLIVVSGDVNTAALSEVWFAAERCVCVCLSVCVSSAK